MKLYLAWYSTWKKMLPTVEMGQNYLETYLVAKSRDMEKEYAWSKKRFFLDSWAYSAKTRWIVININEYINFLLKNEKYFEVYANLDVIWDAEATDRNQKIMESKWLRPLPTYHLWEPVKYFEALVHNYDYIWIWGLVGEWNQNNKMKPMFDYIFWYVVKHKLKTKFHGWWMTSPAFMRAYPFYSVDSTGWLSWWKFRSVMFYKNWKLKTVWADKMRWSIWIDWWKKNHEMINLHNARAYCQYAEYCTRLHRAKGMEYRL